MSSSSDHKRLARAGSLALLASLWIPGVGAAQRVAEAPGSASRSSVAQPSVVDQTRALFAPTRDWFRIVETLEYERLPDGALVPRHDTLTHARVRWQDEAGHTVVPRFARRFASATRIGVGTEPTIFVDLVPERASNVSARIEDGLVVYPDAYLDTDVIYKSTPTHTDEYLLVRSRRAPSRWTYRVELGSGIARIRQAGNSVEAVDANGAAWLRALHPRAVDVEGRRAEGTIWIDGDVLVVQIDLSLLEPPILIDPDWRTTGDMSQGRFYHRAIVLDDGRVMVSGGCSSSVCSGDLTIPACRSVVGAVESLSMDTRTWSRIGEAAARFFHSAERLSDGRVLMAGGCSDTRCDVVLTSAEVFDPSDDSVRVVASLAEARAGMVAATLPDGRVLLAGGCTNSGCSTVAEAFDPATGRFDPLAELPAPRGRAEAVVLSDGRVLATGGCTTIACNDVLTDAVVYDPTTDAWQTTSAMTSARAGHYAALLPDGRVLVGGGCREQACTTVLRSAEIFTPSTMSFAAIGQGIQQRVGAVALPTPDGRVMISQGCSSRSVCDLTNELYDSEPGAFALLDPAVTPRGFHALVIHEPTAQVLANGGCQPTTCSWWNETFALADLPPPMEMPDGGFPDAGPHDAGVDAGVDGGGGACGCRVPVASSRRRAGWASGLLAAALLVSARRRPR